MSTSQIMATGRRVFSIRYKILILLTLIPVIVLALYLAMALQVFSEDKIAYVYDSAAASSRALGNQINMQLTGLLSSSKSVLQEFALTGEFGEISEAILKTDDRIQWIAAYQFKAGSPVRLKTVEAKEKIFENQFRELGGDVFFPALLREAQSLNRVIRFPFRDERVLVVEKIPDQTTGQDLFFVLMFSMSEVANDFRVPSQFDSYLIGHDGKIFLGPSGRPLAQIQDLVTLSFLSAKNSSNSGTEEVISKKGVPLLASYYKTAQGQLWTLTLVSKSEALRAVDTLIWKSVFFFFVLICGTIIISLFAASGLTSSLSDLFQATRRVAEGHFDIRVQVKSSDEVGSLANSFNAMAEEVARLLQETAQKARMESELKTAQTVQETLFPSNFTQAAGTLVVGFYEPASECGGDWWFHNVIDGKLFIWMGDATGHGAPAALITSAARSATSIIEGLNLSPGQALELLNRAIFDVSKGQIMMTFFIASYDPERGILVYSNASHEAPYLIRKQEGKLKKRDLITLNEVNNPRLGQNRTSTYQEASIQLLPGDRLIVYTDGVTDLRSPQNEALGEREFLKIVLEANQEFPPINEVMARLQKDFQEHRRSAPLPDDLTYFMVQVQETSV